MFSVFVIAILLLIPSSLLAQDFSGIFSSDAAFTSLELEGVMLPEKSPHSEERKTGVTSQTANLGQQLYKTEQVQVTGGLRYNKLDTTSKGPVLHDYYQYQGSLSYRRNTKEDRYWLGSMSFGPASDRPFRSARDNTISANVISKFNPKWFGVINYSNNRSFLNNVPLPGFFYVSELGRERTLVLGLPFIILVRPLSEKISLRYTALLPWTHKLKVLYSIHPTFRPYFGYEQVPFTYFRHDREDKEDRLFWFERRLALGLETGLSRQVRIDFSSGLAFDRQLFEARNFSQNKENLIKLENSYFVALNLRFNL